MPIPTPSGGEEQDAFIGRCMGNDVMKKEFPDQKQRSAVCYSQWRKKDKVKPMILENKKIIFDSPFSVMTEGLEEKADPNRVSIKGTMLKATTSRNGWTYEMEEIEKANFSGNAISVDHSDSIKDVVGEFTPTITDDGIDYKGYIQNTPYHPGIVDMARAGLLKHVSVEAIVKEMKREGDKTVARGLDFTGFGIVKTPGITDATFAIAEAFKEIDNKEVKDMVEETKSAVVEQKVDIEPLKKEIEALKEQFKAQNEPLRGEIDSLKEELKVLKEQPKTQGIVTEDKPKYDFSLVKENKGGKTNWYIKDARKRDGTWAY